MPDRTGAIPGSDVIESDIREVIGGHFTPDALSPEVYDEVLTRMRGRPQDYIAVFQRMFLGLNFDAVAQSSWYLPSFLSHLAEPAPDLVRETAGLLLKQYDAVMIVYDHASDRERLFGLLPEEIENLVERLEIRRIELRELIR